ncbi:MAG TPA: sugar phosphate nucleotidyltransferase [Candidatus Saccharimonadales bacterium]|nr:sugar phosphate nucleotidyltransferase [Candidatus Saccharimonadales bacterium]
MTKKMSAVILASGAGTRLGEITANTPKTLLEFGGKPYLQYLIDWLLNGNIDDIVVTVCTHAEQIEQFISDNYGNRPVRTVREPSVKNSVQSTRYGLEQAIHAHSLLLTADNLWEMSLRDFIARHLESDADATIMVTGNPDVPNSGAVKVAKHDDRIVKMLFPGEDEDLGEPVRPASTMGMYAVRREMLLRNLSPDDKKVVIEPMNRLGSVRAYWNEGFFFDFGTPANYKYLREHPELITANLHI